MRSKTLFDVKLPATGKHYDFWIPDTMPMQTVTLLVSEAMQVIEPDFYKDNGNSALMYLNTGQIQDPSATVQEIGFSNGDRFVLV